MSNFPWILVLVFSVSYLEVSSVTDEKFVKACNCFTFNLMKKLKTEDGNLIASAFSADVVLSMLLMGAKGSTAEQLNQILQNKDNGLTDEDIRKGFNSVLRQLNGTKDVSLNIADSIWIDKSFQVLEEYKKTVEETFLAQEESVDFAGNANGATEQINQWANEKTNSLIPKLFDQDLDPSTVMVLANAIYFKGEWLYKFDTQKTEDKPFFNGGNENDQKMVPLMNQKAKFMYMEDQQLKAQFLQMDYKGKQISFIAALPNEGVSLDDFEKDLNCEKIGDTLQMSESIKVNVTLPKFDIKSDLDLVQPLNDLGLTSIFSNPDLSGMGSGNLAVSDIIQKARIKVYEEGSEAAAVTGGVVSLTASIGPPPMEVQFLANRPFYYFIVDKSTGLILFHGRINKL